MDLRRPTTIADRFMLALAGGCFGLVFGVLLTFVVPTVTVIWYTAAYFMLVSFALGPAAADIVAMVIAAVSLLFQVVVGPPAEVGYETNPFDKPWHWLLLALFIVGFIAVVAYAAQH